MKNALIGKGMPLKVDELVPTVSQEPVGQSVGVMRGSPDHGTLKAAVSCAEGRKYGSNEPVGAKAPVGGSLRGKY